MTHADPSTPPVTPRPAVPVSARAEALRDVIEAFYDAVYDYGWNTAEWERTPDGRREHYALSDRVAACRARLDAELAALVQDAERLNAHCLTALLGEDTQGCECMGVRLPRLLRRSRHHHGEGTMSMHEEFCGCGEWSCTKCHGSDAVAGSLGNAHIHGLPPAPSPTTPETRCELPAHIDETRRALMRRWANRMRGRYGVPVWLVGSALREDNPDPRDWDFRLTLPDEDFAIRFGPVDQWRDEDCTGEWTHVRFRWSDQCVKDTKDAVAWMHLNADVQIYPESQVTMLYADLPRVRIDSFPDEPPTAPPDTGTGEAREGETLTNEMLAALEEMSALVAVKGPMLRELIRGYRLRARPEAVDGRLREAVDENVRLRRNWWLAHGYAAHGSTMGLYGDDGEMSCNVCGIDFKRTPVEQIEARLWELTLSRAALADAERPEEGRPHV